METDVIMEGARMKTRFATLMDANKVAKFYYYFKSVIPSWFLLLR